MGLDCLERFGRPVVVGSAALGLMVRPDLDITVICPALDGACMDGVADLAATLIRRERVRSVTIRDDTGQCNVDPNYPDGLYLGVKYRTSEGRNWNLDLWFVDEPDRQPDLRHLSTLAPRLTEPGRLAILTIKQALIDNPEYASTASSFDVYTAVLDHGVTTFEEFAHWSRTGTQPQP